MQAKNNRVRVPIIEKRFLITVLLFIASQLKSTGPKRALWCKKTGLLRLVKQFLKGLLLLVVLFDCRQFVLGRCWGLPLRSPTRGEFIPTKEAPDNTGHCFAIGSILSGSRHF